MEMKKIEVPITTLDKLILDYSGLIKQTTMIKLDVQGDELFVLEGASQFIRDNSVKLMVEWAPAWMSNAGSDPNRLPEYLLDLGFTKITAH